jgi:hypothetical protein
VVVLVKERIKRNRPPSLPFFEKSKGRERKGSRYIAVLCTPGYYYYVRWNGFGPSGAVLIEVGAEQCKGPRIASVDGYQQASNIERGNRKSKSTVRSISCHHRVALNREGGVLRSVLEPEECLGRGVLGGGRVFADLIGVGDCALSSRVETGERRSGKTTRKS